MNHAHLFSLGASTAFVLFATGSLSQLPLNAASAQAATTAIPATSNAATATTMTTTTITTAPNTGNDDLSIAPTPVILSTANLGGTVDRLQPLLAVDKIMSVNEEGQAVNRYLYSVTNADALPTNIFARAPYLKPLSENADACRTWVYMLDQDGNPLSTFATISDKAGLAKLWFAAQAGVALPKKIYVDIWDRQMDVHYRSKLVAVPQ